MDWTKDTEPNIGPDALRIVGLGGSLKPHSSSRAALEVALSRAAEARVETELLDLRILNISMYDPSSKDVPESVTRLVESTYSADGRIETRRPLSAAVDVTITRENEEDCH